MPPNINFRMLLGKAVCLVIAITLLCLKLPVHFVLHISAFLLEASEPETVFFFNSLVCYSLTRFSHLQVSLNEVIAGVKGFCYILSCCSNVLYCEVNTKRVMALPLIHFTNISIHLEVSEADRA